MRRRGFQVAAVALAWALGPIAAAHAAGPLEQPPQIRPVQPDLMTTAVEVTQGVQSSWTSYQDADGTLDPSLCAGKPSLVPRDTSATGISAAQTYKGVELEAEHRKTVVRVFGQALMPSLTAPPPQVTGVDAALYGSRGGKRLKGSPLLSVEGPRTISGKFFTTVSCLDRADPKGAWTFVLPASWRHGTIALRAKILPDHELHGRGGECDTSYCAQDNSLTVRKVWFQDTGYVTVTPVALEYADAAGTIHKPTVTPEEEIKQPVWTAPTQLRWAGGGNDDTYAGTIDITDIARDGQYQYRADDTNQQKQDKRRAQCSAIEDELEDWADNHNHGDVTFGVFDSSAINCIGVSGGTLLGAGYAYPVVTETSLAHEMGHNFGRSHSDAVTGGCGGAGEDWPPDNKGYMQGIGTDTRTGSAGGNGAYKIILSGKLTPGDPFGFHQDPILYDLMSYCGALDTRFTLSDRGWNEAFGGVQAFLKAFHANRLGSGASSRRSLRTVLNPVLRVHAALDADGVHILGVRRLIHSPAVAPGDSPLTAVFKSAAGDVLASVPMTGRPFVTHDGGNVAVYAAETLIGPTPVKEVDILQDGKVVASRVRSAHVPVVTLTGPDAGTTISDSDPTVTWTATDADHDRLRIAIAYSADGGMTWRQVWVGSNAGSVTIPRAQLPASTDGRLRVLANDGFNQGAAVSGALTIAARRPEVRLDEPLDGRTFRTGGLVTLLATGTTGDGAPLPAADVRWYEGDRLVGTGLSIDRVFSPGVHKLLVEAKDGDLVSELYNVITVKGNAPHVLSYRGPTHIGRHTRKLTFTIAATATGWLKAHGGPARRVGLTARRITVRIHPGSTDLFLPVKLYDAAGATRSTIVVRRR